MVRTEKLTAESLVSAPKRSPLIPSFDGNFGLYSVSTHCIGGDTLNEVRLMSLESGESQQISADGDNVISFAWIPNTSDGDIMFLKSGDRGQTQVIVAASSQNIQFEPYQIAEFDAPVSNLKLKPLDDGSVAFLVSGLVNDDGLLYNSELENEKSTARVFDTVDVRSWDRLYPKHRGSLWYSKLMPTSDFKWSMSHNLSNAINCGHLNTLISNMIGEGGVDFDVCQRGIAVVTRNAKLRDPLLIGSSHGYYIPIESFDLPPSQQPLQITLPDGVGPGMASNIRFSPDGSSIAYLYWEDGQPLGNKGIFMTTSDSLQSIDVFSSAATIAQGSDYNPPTAFEYAEDSVSFFTICPWQGRSCLMKISLQESEVSRSLISEGTVTAFFPLERDKWDELLVTSTSFIDSSLYQILSVPHAEVVRTVSSATRNGTKFGLSRDMITEFWYEGANSVCIHSFMIRPRNFDETKKHPWVLMPHGGPVSHWSDSWSWRWNMVAWAEQGYVLILPNITGSVGYGVEFANGIKNEYGGRAYQDLVNLIHYVTEIPYLDQTKAILAGASFGGYMASWMFGQEIIERFCCAVWHDGIFSLPTEALQSDQVVGEGSFGKKSFPWIKPENWEKYNPAHPTRLKNWHRVPPTLVIHSEKDYRCPITEGLAVFQVLQAQGVPSRFLTFPDENHFVSKPENSLQWHRTVWDWVKRCVDGDIRRGDTIW